MIPKTIYCLSRSSKKSFIISSEVRKSEQKTLLLHFLPTSINLDVIPFRLSQIKFMWKQPELRSRHKNFIFLSPSTFQQIRISGCAESVYKLIARELSGEEKFFRYFPSATFLLATHGNLQQKTASRPSTRDWFNSLGIT